ncbi:hypothetical protein [Novipirellula artificiosorum]|uniref:Uncharacterized protein n=1 Tax=Novipirellula artificiosorum TaxID=2528016 RepID=A0A5C6DWP7_9BACT|nr:hypothetical protein [Novipirellula artificiosorum]TWU39229.1 hypothetical protein Poly41_20510 [Novipirellula artificiosorum]
MSASNRATLINKLFAALKKHYSPSPTQPTRPLLEHLLYASLLQDAPAELADEGMAKCEQDFFDWNEVRVTTISELAQVLSRLPDAVKAATRIKSNLQSVFEEFYTFDIDHLKKENLGKAVAKFEKMPGVTPFVLSYTVQHGLGGHSIPVDYSAMVILMVTEIASQTEAAAGKVPGLERAIPKSKGIEFSDLLHQAAVSLSISTKDKKSRALVDEVAKGSSKRLDEWITGKKAAKKRVAARKAAQAAEDEAEEIAQAEAEKAAKAKPKKPSNKKASAKPADTAASKATSPKAADPKAAKKTKTSKPEAAEAPPAKKNVAPKKVTPKKTAASKPEEPSKTAKKASKKSKSASSSVAKTSSKKSSSRKLTKRKPR